MAKFLPELFAGFTGSLDRQVLAEMQNRIGEDLGRLEGLRAKPCTSGSRGLAPSPTSGRCCAPWCGCVTTSS
jgi:hypothetical protein